MPVWEKRRNRKPPHAMSASGVQSPIGEREETASVERGNAPGVDVEEKGTAGFERGNAPGVDVEEEESTGFERGNAPGAAVNVEEGETASVGQGDAPDMASIRRSPTVFPFRSEYLGTERLLENWTRIHGVLYPENLSAPKKAMRASVQGPALPSRAEQRIDEEQTGLETEKGAAMGRTVLWGSCPRIRFLWADSSDNDPLGPIPEEWRARTKGEDASLVLNAILVEIEDNSPIAEGNSEECLAEETPRASSVENRPPENGTGRMEGERPQKGKARMEGERPKEDNAQTEHERLRWRKTLRKRRKTLERKKIVSTLKGKDQRRFKVPHNGNFAIRSQYDGPPSSDSPTEPSDSSVSKPRNHQMPKKYNRDTSQIPSGGYFAVGGKGGHKPPSGSDTPSNSSTSTDSDLSSQESEEQSISNKGRSNPPPFRAPDSPSSDNSSSSSENKRRKRKRKDITRRKSQRPPRVTKENARKLRRMQRKQRNCCAESKPT
jgi:hypothetical protein